MKNKEFSEYVENLFGYLVTDFGFKVIKRYEENWSRMGVMYGNPTTSVSIIWEFFMADVSVDIIKHVKPGPDFQVGNPYIGLDHVLHHRAPELKLRDVNERVLSDDAIKEDLQRYAPALRRYAYDMLRGDFRFFDEIRRRAGLSVDGSG